MTVIALPPNEIEPTTPITTTSLEMTYCERFKMTLTVQACHKARVMKECCERCEQIEPEVMERSHGWVVDFKGENDHPNWSVSDDGLRFETRKTIATKKAKGQFQEAIEANINEAKTGVLQPKQSDGSNKVAMATKIKVKRGPSNIPPQPICAAEGCDHISRAKGYCTKHLEAQYRGKNKEKMRAYQRAWKSRKGHCDVFGDDISYAMCLWRNEQKTVMPKWSKCQECQRKHWTVKENYGLGQY